MFSAQQIVSDFQMMYNNRWGYIPGSSGQLWTQSAQDKKALTDTGVAEYGQQWVGHKVADCSGAFVNSYRKHGLSIYHGSNRIAREYVVELLPPSCAAPGMTAFKAYKPGDKYYALPSEYKPGGKHYNGDLLDYYHIGLVDADPAYVINAASTKSGVIRSKLQNGWCAVGYLKAIKYENGGETVEEKQMIVTAESGKTVNMRQGPGRRFPVICAVPIGSTVTGSMELEGWAYIHYKGQSGYMQSQFLADAPDQPAQDPPEATPVPPANADAAAWLFAAMEANEAQRDALEHLQKLLTGAVG